MPIPDDTQPAHQPHQRFGHEGPRAVDSKGAQAHAEVLEADPGKVLGPEFGESPRAVLRRSENAAEMVANNNGGEDGNGPRGTEASPPIRREGASSHDEGVCGVDAGDEGRGEDGKATTAETTNSCNVGGGRGSAEEGTIPIGADGDPDHVAGMWTRGRCSAVEAEGRRNDCERNSKGSGRGNGDLLLERQDCENARFLHRFHPETPRGSLGAVPQVPGGDEERRLPFQRCQGSTNQGSAEACEPKLGAEVAEKGCHPDVSKDGASGLGAPALQRTYQRGHAPPVPKLREAFRRGCEVIGASGGVGFNPLTKPSTAEVNEAFGVREKISKSALPLHLKKHVKPINLEMLECLPNKTPSCRKFLLNALGWLRDGNRIGTVTLAPKRPRFSKKHFIEMRGYKYKPLVGLPEGFVDAFVRTEPSKDPKHTLGYRLRPLFAPDANHEGASKDKLQELSMPTKGEIREQGANVPELVIQFDMESYYDQFELSESVKRKMCFCGPDGLVYALERLPMGLRPACEVAQATTWFLLDFEMEPGVKVTTCIDNVRFVGTKRGVVTAVRQFLERCRKVGAQLDKWPASDSETDIVAMGERGGDFLGERYDYDKQQRSLTKKTLSKLETLKKWLDMQGPESLLMTARQLSVLMGLLFWTASVLDLPLSRYFHLLRDYRQAAAKASTSQDYDATAVNITPTARTEMMTWLNVAMGNSPVPMAVQTFGEPSLNLITDASGVGYSAIATTDFTDCQVVGGVWSWSQLTKAQSSVWAEPEAIYLACLRFVRPEDRFVRIYTDHSPVVYAGAAGYAKGFSPNHLLERLNKTYPGTMFEIVHVKGVNNPSDRFSRLGEETGGDAKILNRDELEMLAMLAADKRGKGPEDNVSVFAHKKRLPFMV